MNIACINTVCTMYRNMHKLNTAAFKCMLFWALCISMIALFTYMYLCFDMEPITAVGIGVLGIGICN